MEPKFMDTVTLRQTVYPYCPLGKDYYQAYITVICRSQEKFLDFIDATSFMRGLSGKNLIIEDVAEKCHDFFTGYYADVAVEVEAISDTHCHVTVRKEGNSYEKNQFRGET